MQKTFDKRFRMVFLVSVENENRARFNAEANAVHLAA